MNKLGKYIYGIVNSGNVLQIFTPVSLSEWREHKPQVTDFASITTTIPSTTIAETKTPTWIYTIPYKDISALVSDSRMIDITNLPRNLLERLQRKHRDVIEKIMNLKYTIIPVNIGTFAENETEVRHILQEGYWLLKEILKEIKNLIEIDVIVTWRDFKAILRQVAEQKEIKELKEKLLTNHRKITLTERIALNSLTQQVLKRKVEELVSRLQNVFKDICREFKMLEPMNPGIVMNAALLINKSEKHEFYNKVEWLNTRFGEKLEFQCLGPLPPYSFYTLEIKQKYSDKLWHADNLLPGNKVISQLGLKQTYKEATLLSPHSVVNPGGKDFVYRSDELIRNYAFHFNHPLARQHPG
ncbi:GvpL/GvpF family gas vesicle protein [Candidatus Sumerlaeota bacterium]|nr:GvpL/GvpF family gas vesicle protein [Candidatus Sumerlaeota bacterium]